MIEHNSTMSRKLLIALFFAFLLLILFFGLRPKGFYLYNNVKWITNQTGIHLDKYGIAYTGLSFNSPQDSYQNVSIEFALNPDTINDNRFKIILVFHNGEDNQQLIVGQWRSSLIVENGDDYDGKKRIPKIYVSEILAPRKTTFVSITSGKEGTRLYLNGRIAKTNKKLFLRIPDGSSRARLVVGNSVYGRHSWNGDMYGLAVYGYTLKSDDVESHFNRWNRDRNFSFMKKHAPEALYLFNEKKGQRAFDKAGGEHHDLEIPSKMMILKKVFLAPLWQDIRLNSSFVLDIIMNLAGFVPFGFFLSALLLKTDWLNKKYSIFLTVFVCFIISLIIEIVQVWMPTRYSQMMDLILNTFGGVIGAMIAYYFFMRILPSRLERTQIGERIEY